MTTINLYESEWEEITHSEWVELKRDGLNIKLDGKPSRYYKKIQNEVRISNRDNANSDTQSLEEVESSSLKGESIPDICLHTKQNGSHDLHPTSKNDSRWQTIIGNSGDTDKSADIMLNYCKCGHREFGHRHYVPDGNYHLLNCKACDCKKYSNSEGESLSGGDSAFVSKSSKTPSTKPAPSETFCLSDKIEICDEHEERELISVSNIKEAVRLLKRNHIVKIEFGSKDYCDGFNEGCKYMKDKIDKLLGDKLCQ